MDDQPVAGGVVDAAATSLAQMQEVPPHSRRVAGRLFQLNQHLDHVQGVAAAAVRAGVQGALLTLSPNVAGRLSQLDEDLALIQGVAAAVQRTGEPLLDAENDALVQLVRAARDAELALQQCLAARACGQGVALAAARR